MEGKEKEYEILDNVGIDAWYKKNTNQRKIYALIRCFLVQQVNEKWERKDIMLCLTVKSLFVFKMG